MPSFSAYVFLLVAAAGCVPSETTNREYSQRYLKQFYISYQTVSKIDSLASAPASAFTVTNQNYVALLDPNNAQLNSRPDLQKYVNFQQSVENKYLSQDVDASGAGVYQTAITWQQAGQSVELTVLLGCVDTLITAHPDDKKLPPELLSPCFAMGGGTVVTNKSEYDRVDYFPKLTLDVTYQLPSAAEYHLTGVLEYDSGHLHGVYADIQCTVSCTETCSGPGCLGDTDYTAKCHYTCGTGPQGDLEFTYYGPEGSESKRTKAFTTSIESQISISTPTIAVPKSSVLAYP